jgi:hypothetical protein
MFTGSRRAEQLSLRSQQRVVATVEESVLKTEMSGLESQEEDAPKRILFFKTMSWLGQIRPHRRHDSWSPSLWQTFFSTSMGAQIPAIAEKLLETYGCRKFQLDPLTTNPVCVRRVNLLVCSLPLHRHSYIGFIFRFRFIDS